VTGADADADTDARRAAIRRYVDDLLNGPDPGAAARDLLSPDFLFTGPGNREGIRGPEAFAAFQDVMRGALDGLRFDLTDAIVDGDRAALVLRMTGVHRALFAGVEPIGAQVDLELVDILRFECGRIAQITAYLDAAEVRRQLTEG
jgi:predicted ester cyclase